MDPLTDTEKQMVDFAALRFKFAGAKEAAITERFGLRPSVFYLRLNQLLDEPAAVAYSPGLVNRLRRLRDVRREQRSARARL